VLTAARVDAAEALRIGLANRVVAPDELESAAAERRPPRHQGR
jgi:enoyl-CoA hydratase/carnithine racemase